MEQPPVRTTAADYHYHVYTYNSAKPWELGPAQPDRDKERFYSMYEDVIGLFETAVRNGVPNPALTVLAEVTADGNVYEIQALSFGGPDPLGATPQIVFTGGVHAREWIGTEITYLLAEYLIINYSAATTGLSPYQQVIKDLLDQRRIHIIPMVNPAGNFYTVTSPDPGSRLWRRNRRPLPATAAAWQTALTIPGSGLPQPPFRNVQQAGGVTSYDVPRFRSNPIRYDTIALPNAATIGVDLNRNFATPAFGFSEKPNYTNGVPAQNNYFGPSPASERETQAVQAFVTPLGNVAASIDYHSFSEYILYPSELSYANAVGASFINLGRVLQRLIASSLGWSFSYDYDLGTPIDLVRYDAVGTVADRIGELKASRSFVIELDPGPRSDPPGFKLPPDRICGVFEKNIRGALALIMAADQATTFTAPTTFGIFNRQTISSAESQLLSWNVYGRGNRLPRWPL